MTENTKPFVGGYDSNGGTGAPPAAARFNEGAQHRAQIEHATEARREHSHQHGAPRRKFSLARPFSNTGWVDRLPVLDRSSG
jgi:hypothetical protein